jgi:hypothetical protein
MTVTFTVGRIDLGRRVEYLRGLCAAGTLKATSSAVLYFAT